MLEELEKQDAPTPQLTPPPQPRPATPSILTQSSEESLVQQQQTELGDDGGEGEVDDCGEPQVFVMDVDEHFSVVKGEGDKRRYS